MNSQGGKAYGCYILVSVQSVSPRPTAAEFSNYLQANFSLLYTLPLMLFLVFKRLLLLLCRLFRITFQTLLGAFQLFLMLCRL